MWQYLQPQMDKDNDGQISWSEFVKGIADSVKEVSIPEGFFSGDQIKISAFTSNLQTMAASKVDQWQSDLSTFIPHA